MSIADYDNTNIFAKIIAGTLDCHKVYEDKHTLALMDLMPQAPGHVLVLPKQAAVDLSQLEPTYAQAVMLTAQKVLAAQRQVFDRQGVVQMQLNGEQAGQTVAHYHLHLIPTSIHELGKHANNQASQEQLAKHAEQLSDAIANPKRPT